MLNSIYRIKNLITYIFLLVSLSIEAQTNLTGSVMCDNLGIEGVVVTDGYTCVKTDQRGHYSIQKDSNSKYVYLSLPSGYITKVESTIPEFYKVIKENNSIYNFELTKNTKSDLNHTVLVQADAQVTSISDLDQYNVILKDAKSHMNLYSKNDVFGIDCGDIVGDSPQFFPEYIKRVSTLNFPIFRAIGNHDMDYYGRSNETSTKTFEKYFGPKYYSFNKGKAHYIVIDNNFFLGRDYFYMGYVDETTFKWLEQDLSAVEKGSLVFLIIHIPSQLTKEKQAFEYSYSSIADQTTNATALYNILEPYNTHIISGHMHYNLNICFTPTLMEHNTASVCGTWWQLGVCLDGAPRGYAVYKVNGNQVEWYYKGVGYNADYQMKVYNINSVVDYPNDIIANVWNYDDKWKVEWIEDGVLMGQMIKFTGYDPDAAIMCADKSKVKYSWISPVQTEHLFRATPKNKNAHIEVRVTDRFGNVFIEKIK